MSNQPKHPKVAKGRPVTDKRKKAISDKARTFVDEYLVDLNGTQAAIRAGYSKSTARQAASELLSRPDIQELVTKAMADRAARTHITADRVLQELAKVAFFDPRKLLYDDGTPRPVSELDDATAGGLSGMDVAQEFDKERSLSAVVRKVKGYNKVEALGLCMRHLGMLRDKVEHSGPHGQPLAAAQVVPVFNITLTEEKES